MSTNARQLRLGRVAHHGNRVGGDGVQSIRDLDATDLGGVVQADVGQVHDAGIRFPQYYLGQHRLDVVLVRYDVLQHAVLERGAQGCILDGFVEELDRVPAHRHLGRSEHQLQAGLGQILQGGEPGRVVRGVDDDQLVADECLLAAVGDPLCGDGVGHLLGVGAGKDVGRRPSPSCAERACEPAKLNTTVAPG